MKSLRAGVTQQGRKPKRLSRYAGFSDYWRDFVLIHYIDNGDSQIIATLLGEPFLPAGRGACAKGYRRWQPL
jgi:hypothetical protein